MLLLEQWLPGLEGQQDRVAGIGLLRAAPSRRQLLEPARPWAALRWQGGGAARLLGPQRGARALTLDAGQGLVSLYLHPATAAALSGRAVAELVDQAIELPGCDLVADIADVMPTQDPLLGALRRLELGLQGLQPHAPAAEPGFDIALPARLEAIGYQLDAWREQLGIGLRSLQRHCLRHWGLAPQLLLRLLRARRAAELIRRPPRPALRLLARQLGYADGAHFSREYLRFIGRRPSEHAARRG